MDYRLVEFAFKLPWHYKLHIEYGKYIHRNAAMSADAPIFPDAVSVAQPGLPARRFARLGG